MGGGGAESLTAISHSVGGVPYHTTKEKCAMSGIFEGVVKCRKEKGRLALARKRSIFYIIFVAANLMGRTLTADGGGFRFDQEAPLRRGFAEFFFFW